MKLTCLVCLFAATSIPPAPNNILNTHPLLVRGPDTHSSASGRAISRPINVRTRAAYRYNPHTQTLVHYVEDNGRVSRLGHSNTVSASGIIDR